MGRRLTLSRDCLLSLVTGLDHRAGVVTWQQVRRPGCPVTGGVGVVGDDRRVRGRIVYEPGNGNPCRY
jgi:hypothetical protein